MEPSLAEYIKGDYNEISGACDKEVFKIASIIDAFQKNNEIKGSIGEIGVRDGRFFIGLSKLLRPDEKCLALDIFDDQMLNIDGSGWRPKEYGVPFFDWAKKNNLVEGKNLVCLKADSLALSLKEKNEVLDLCGVFRMFSIDGGHEAEHLVNDLDFASDLSTGGSVLMLDDYYNPNFPGVHEGFAAYMLQKKRYVPFAFSHGKLFVITKTYYRKMLEFMDSSVAKMDKKPAVYHGTTMYGYRVMHLKWA